MSSVHVHTYTFRCTSIILQMAASMKHNFWLNLTSFSNYFFYILNCFHCIMVNYDTNGYQMWKVSDYAFRIGSMSSHFLLGLIVWWNCLLKPMSTYACFLDSLSCDTKFCVTCLLFRQLYYLDRCAGGISAVRFSKFTE